MLVSQKASFCNRIFEGLKFKQIKILNGQFAITNKMNARTKVGLTFATRPVYIGEIRFFCHNIIQSNRQVDVVIKDTAIDTGSQSSIPGPVKSDTVANGSLLLQICNFLRNGVAQAPSCGDGTRHSLHASA